MAAPALVTDSSSYLPPELARALGVRVVPLHVTLGEWSFAETAVAPAEFYDRLRASTARPTTSQPAPGEFLEAFTEAAAEGAPRVLCVTCAAAMSGTYSSAVLAAGLSPVPVDVVDSGTISGGLTLAVLRLARELAAGTAYDEVLALARSMSGRVRSTWCSDTHALLAAGGRLADDVPAGVPVMALDGTVRVLGAARSVEQALELQAAVVRAAARACPTWVSVGHGDVPRLADQLAALLEGAPGVLGIDRYVVGPVVGAHAGAGNVGASYLVEVEMEQFRPVVEGGTPFARTLGATLVSLGDGAAQMRLDAAESLHNHVGGPHAATLFGLGETTAAAVVVSVFHDLVASGAVPLIKAASISYQAIATGVVTATAHLAGDGEDGVRACVAERGVATFPVEVVFRREADGVETGSMTAQMALKRFG